MKITQQGAEFVPITITLETKEEAAMLWDMMLKISRETKKQPEFEMATAISDWITNEAHL
jgi:hypothetical protein